MIENRTLGSKIFDVINVIIMIICALLCIVPVWYVLCVSLSSKEAVNAGLVSFWPVGFNLFSYQKILGESDFFRSFWVSIQRVLLGTGVSMFCILLAAYPLSRTSKQFPKRSIFMWILVFCMLFNGGTVPWYITMKSYGLVDNIWGLVLGMGLNVYNLILAVNFFKNLPAELEEAALIDGSNPLNTLLKIIVPLSMPSIATITLLCVIGHWNDYFTGRIYINSPSKLPLQTYIYALSTEMSAATLVGLTPEEIVAKMKVSSLTFNCAKVVIATIPVLLIYPWLQKYFVKGLVMGAVKG